ncbi:MAG: hypothetical protein QGI83_10255 [Candidatus Latescibacteria bacterium]|jgi:hypothetical protein|nr:hypothetical protein [Candidatus Latescibacterota bacterium]
MNSDNMRSIEDIKVDETSLYREESITDLKVASIRRLIPIKPDGSTDESRDVIYIGSTQLMTQAGLLPVQSRIEALTLQEAIQKFPEAVKQGIEKMMEEVREMQRQEASRIVVPGQMPGGTIPPQGGAPGGGKIQLG